MAGQTGEEPTDFKGYRYFTVWQKAMDLVVECYRATGGFPKGETFGLSSHLHRAAASVPASIAEGRAKPHGRDFLRPLSSASGSLAELETHILIAERLNFRGRAEGHPLLDRTCEIGRTIAGLCRSLEKRQAEDLTGGEGNPGNWGVSDVTCK
jgi:four helix bundle protein